MNKSLVMSAALPSKAPEIITFGCRLNAYESELMRRQAAAAGLEDTIIVNTCAVTAEAERQARQAIRKARRRRPGARLIVTGCAAQIAPERFAAMDEVDQVLGNSEKLSLARFVTENAPPVAVADIAEIRETAGHLVGGLEGRARAFVQIQNGCDHACTFCIIPQGRGPSRSVPMGAIAAELRALVANGFREAVLTGVDITAYGADLPGRPRLGQLVRRLLAAVPELPRLRLSSLDPAEVDDDLWQAIAEEERLMPHLHLSLQAGDDMILKRMRRRHGRADAIEFCRRARRLRPDIVFGADLIAGFPTETDTMFAHTLDLVEACGLTYLHVFPYSPRPDTPAARMPQVAPETRKSRAKRLRQAGGDALAAYLERQIGRTASILVEAPGKGRTAPFAEARLNGAAADAPAGSLIAAQVTGATADHLLCESV